MALNSEVQGGVMLTNETLSYLLVPSYEQTVCRRTPAQVRMMWIYIASNDVPQSGKPHRWQRKSLDSLP